MKVKCEYCGQMIDDQEARCPNCGAPNANIRRVVDQEPHTVEELRLFCERHNLTPEITRFFIGVDYREPKAFGIYQDSAGQFVVYKNKADGNRAVRYRGTDEAYAVHELYARLMQERLNQQRNNLNKGNTPPKKKKGLNLWTVIIIAVVVIALCANIFGRNKYKNGYYRYGNTTYYSLSDTWYTYGSGGWIYADTVPDELTENSGDFFESSAFNTDYGVSDFRNTDYYSDWEDSQSSDSDSDWGSDWDSDSTDWDSDW